MLKVLKPTFTLERGESTPWSFHGDAKCIVTVLRGRARVELGYPPTHFKQGRDGINMTDLGLAALLHFLSAPPSRAVELSEGGCLEVDTFQAYRVVAVENLSLFCHCGDRFILPEHGQEYCRSDAPNSPAPSRPGGTRL